MNARDWHADDYLATLRRDLLRFALLQLRDVAAAEDAVQEALAAAWAGESEFAGQSQHKTWVFGILRHKLIDTMRRRRRTVNLSALEDELADDAALDQLLFNASGHWDAAVRPRAWPQPETAVHQRQFWQLFHACLDLLPAQTGRVFAMRELLDLEPDEICGELAISSNHCSVLLYRARLRLRTCLSEKGYGARELSDEV